MARHEGFPPLPEIPEPRQKKEPLASYRNRVVGTYGEVFHSPFPDPGSLRSFAAVDEVRRRLNDQRRQNWRRGIVQYSREDAKRGVEKYRRERALADSEVLAAIPPGELDSLIDDLLAEPLTMPRAQKWVCGQCVLEGGQMRPKRRAVMRRPRRV